MAATEEFRLPNTPPQGHTFPPAAAQDMSTITATQREAAGKHGKKPSLTINTREVSPPQQQLPPPPPPPPPRARKVDTGKQRSNSQPVRPLQLAPVNLPGPPARKRDSTGTRPQSTTPTYKSIFPYYNPAAPGEVDNRKPASIPATSPPPTQADFQSSYAQSVCSTARSPPMGQGSLSQAFAAPAEPSGCPLPSYRESMYGIPVVIQSTPNDVIDLWCLANGQDDQELALSYNLGLDCTDLELHNELICLTSTAGAVYTLRATHNALNITRTNPLNGANTMSIAAPTLYTLSEKSQLLTTIFPVLAKIRAIDQASSLTISQALNRSQALAIERETITRAHANTAAPLLWDARTRSWYISLPQYSPNADSIDIAPSHHTLPIEINPNVSVRVLEPPSAHSATNPILTMSLPAKTLIVHSHALANLPTPYGPDILVSAMMILLLHLHRTESFLSTDSGASVPATSIPSFAPPPRVGDSRTSRASSRTRNNTSERSASRVGSGSRLGNLLHPNRETHERSRSHLGIYESSRSISRLSTHSAAATTLHGSPPLGVDRVPGTPALEKGVGEHISDKGFRRMILRIRGWAQGRSAC